MTQRPASQNKGSSDPGEGRRVGGVARERMQHPPLCGQSSLARLSSFGKMKEELERDFSFQVVS